MQTVRLTKALDGFQSGQVLAVDPNSAAALIARGDAEVLDTTEVPEPSADDEGAAAPGLTRQSPKPELVEFAIGAGWPREQAEGSTRAQIADAFGLE